jgi:hypothetical protein
MKIQQNFDMFTEFELLEFKVPVGCSRQGVSLGAGTDVTLVISIGHSATVLVQLPLV